MKLSEYIDDIACDPEEVLKRIAGTRWALPNGWGNGVVVGFWNTKNNSHRVLLAWPNATAPDQLFNEEASSLERDSNA